VPIRDELTYAKMSYKDFIVSYERLRKGELRLSAFRAYKAERRLLQSLAMRYDLYNRKTKCAVPKKEMLLVASQLEGLFKGIRKLTEMALSLFDEYRKGEVKKEDIISLLSGLNYEWLSGKLSQDEISEIKKLQSTLNSL